MFYNKLCSNLFRGGLIFVLYLFTLFNLRFSISDKGSREESLMDLSDLPLNLFSQTFRT